MKNFKLLSFIILQLFFFQTITAQSTVVLKDGRSGAAQPGATTQQVETKQENNTNIYDPNFSDQDVPGQRANQNADKPDWVFPDDLEVLVDELSATATPQEVVDRINMLEEKIQTLVQYNEQLRLENRTIKKSLDNCCSANSTLTPADAYILQNAPNPFNEASAINYFIPENADARIEVSSVKGEMIRSFDLRQGGFGMVEMDGKALQTGTYIYSLFVDGEFVDSKVMVITQ